MPNEAPVMNEIKAPNVRIKLKILKDQVGKMEKSVSDTSQLWLIEAPHWSHQFVARCGVEVPQIYHSPSRASG